MRWQSVLLVFLNIILIFALIIYWLNPGGDMSFDFNQGYNSNFSASNNTVQMQFYENMRFPAPEISYSIDDLCSLKRKNSMTEAFAILENYTILSFYPVSKNPEITVSCQNRQMVEDGLFIAGEGGPTNITDANQYKIIWSGEILLIKDTECERPNVAVHELLHVLGFEHSDNENNILYPVSKCRQVIGTDIPDLINKLYSIPGLPDLKFVNASAEINGRSLSVNFSVRNEGLSESSDAKIKIFTEDKVVEDIDLKPLSVGQGVKIELSNIWLSKTKIEELGIVIESDFDELSHDNNQVLLVKTN